MIDSNRSIALTLGTIPSSDHLDSIREPTAIVVENVGVQCQSQLATEWQAQLTSRLNISPGFFARHAEQVPNAQQKNLWASVFGPDAGLHRKPVCGSEPPEPSSEVVSSDGRAGGAGTSRPSFLRKYWHVDGVIELDHGNRRLQPTTKICQPDLGDRPASYHPHYGWMVCTKISYLALTNNIHLFLVDAPVNPLTPLERPLDAKLYLPVSTSRGGLITPRLFSQPHFSLFECLKHFLAHAWHLRNLHWDRLSAETLLYLVETSTWYTNLTYLKSTITDLAFEDVISRPDIRLNTELHERRYQLASLSRWVEDMVKWIPAHVEPELTRAQIGDGYVGYPGASARQMLEEARVLDKFLMDTFQLLMSTVSVMAAETSLREARSAQKLMWLASIYLPLTLATSIFGMNINEINGSPVPWWACLATLVIMAILTMTILGVFNIMDAGTSHKAEWEAVKVDNKKQGVIQRLAKLVYPSVRNRT